MAETDFDPNADQWVVTDAWLSEEQARDAAYEQNGARSWYVSPVDGQMRSVHGQWSTSELANRMTMGDATPRHEAAAADFWAMAAHQAYVGASFHAAREEQRDLDEETAESARAAAEAAERVATTAQILAELEDVADRLNDRADAHEQEQFDTYNAEVAATKAVYDEVVDRLLHESMADNAGRQDAYSDTVWDQAKDLARAGITAEDVQAMAVAREVYHEQLDVDAAEERYDRRQAELANPRVRAEREAKLDAAWKVAVDTTYREVVLDYGNDGRPEDDRSLTAAEERERAAAVEFIAGETGVSEGYVRGQLNDAAFDYGNLPNAAATVLDPPEWPEFVDEFASRGFGRSEHDRLIDEGAAKAGALADVDGELTFEDGSTFRADEPVPVELTEAGAEALLAADWDEQAAAQRQDTWEARNPGEPWASREDTVAAAVDALGPDAVRPEPSEDPFGEPIGAATPMPVPAGLAAAAAEALGGMTAEEFSSALMPEFATEIAVTRDDGEVVAPANADSEELADTLSLLASRVEEGKVADPLAASESAERAVEQWRAAHPEGDEMTSREFMEQSLAPRDLAEHRTGEDPGAVSDLAEDEAWELAHRPNLEEEWDAYLRGPNGGEPPESFYDEIAVASAAEAVAAAAAQRMAAQDGDGLDERVDAETAAGRVDALEAEAATLRQDLADGNIPAEEESEVSAHAQYLDEQAEIARGVWPYDVVDPSPAVRAELDANPTAWHSAVDTLELAPVTDEEFSELVEEAKEAARLAEVDAAADVQEQAELAGDEEGERRKRADEDPDPAGWSSALADVPEWVQEQGSEAVADHIAERAERESVSSLVASDAAVAGEEPDPEGEQTPSDEVVEADEEYGPDAYQQALEDPDEDDGTVYDDPEFLAELEKLAAERDAAGDEPGKAAEAVEAATEAVQEAVMANAESSAPASEASSTAPGDAAGDSDA